MKLLVKISIYVFVLGVIGTIVSLQVTGAFSNELIERSKEEKFNANNIDSISIKTSSVDVVTEVSKGDHIVLQWGGEASKELWDRYELKTNVDHDKLSVLLRKKDRLGINFGFMRENVGLRLSLPEKMYKEAEIHTSSGEVTMQGHRIDVVSVATSSGDINLYELSEAQEMSVRASSGTISMENIDIHSLKTNTSSGDINGEMVKVNDFNADTSSGTVEVDELTLNGNANVDTSSGDVRFKFWKQPNSFTINFSSSSGEERLDLEGVDYERKSEHKVRGVKGSGDQEINVNTSSGDFHAQ